MKIQEPGLPHSKFSSQKPGHGASGGTGGLQKCLAGDAAELWRIRNCWGEEHQISKSTRRQECVSHLNTVFFSISLSFCKRVDDYHSTSM